MTPNVAEPAALVRSGIATGLARDYHLLRALAVRDVRARYRRSMLGPLWAVLQPLLLMIVFTVLHNFIGIPSDGIPYPLFSYSALVPWTFFAAAVTGCAPSVIANAGILKKMAVTREVFPLSAVVTAAFDFAAASIVLVGLRLYYGVPLDLSLLWLLPLMLLIALLALSVGMTIAALGVFKRDLVIATAFLLQLWLYATPIIYPLNSVPERWRTLYSLNPMVGLIEGCRNVLARGIAPDLHLLILGLPMLLLCFAVGWPLFRRMSQYFADVL